MEKMNDLRDLLKHEIEDLYSAEEQIMEALPKMMKKAGNRNLKKALSEHLRVTEEQKNRLDKIQQMLNKGQEKGNGKKGFLSGLFGGGRHVCKGMQGIIEEGNNMMAEEMAPAVRDAAIIACAQKVEHYEICGYGTARTYAQELGLEPVARMLELTLNEEYEADDRLTSLAVERVNIQAGATREAMGPGKERAGREEVTRASREMVPAGNHRDKNSVKSEAGKRSTAAGGRPKASASPRSEGQGRTSASAKRTTSGKKGGSSRSAR